jgi:transposase InsO family protein
MAVHGQWHTYFSYIKIRRKNPRLISDNGSQFILHNFKELLIALEICRQKRCPVWMALWLAYYNSERLHSVIGYLTHDDVFYGGRDSRLAGRREKPHTTRINRQEYWKAQAAKP